MADRRRHVGPLEIISVQVPEAAVEAYEAALASVCDTVGLFRDQAAGTWCVEGIRTPERSEEALTAALVLAAMVSGINASAKRVPIDAADWLARSYATFPPQLIGKRFCIRGTHVRTARPASRLCLTVDAGLAFGSGEHGSTRGCLRAIERLGRSRPRRILDIGTGSGILAMAVATLVKRPVLATDIEPWSVHVARQNVRLNRLTKLVRTRLADGWNNRLVRAGGPYDLVLANILARPLCLMARRLAMHLTSRAHVVLSGLTRDQERWVLAAHRRCWLTLELRLHEGPWTTLVLRSGRGRQRQPIALQASASH